MCQIEIAGEAILALGLAVGSFWDLKIKKIPVLLVAILGLVGVVFKIYSGQFLTWDTILSLLAGIAAIIISYMTDEIFGMGDALLVFVAGLYMNFNLLVGWGLLSISLAGLVAMVMLFVFRKPKNFELPMIPVLFISYVIIMAFNEC